MITVFLRLCASPSYLASSPTSLREAILRTSAGNTTLKRYTTFMTGRLLLLSYDVNQMQPTATVLSWLGYESSLKIFWTLHLSESDSPASGLNVSCLVF
jgi:hypothetical protein